MEIAATGLNARLVDLGRVGHQHKGFTQSGAIDMHSHKLANAILGQAFDAATIEVLLGGFEAVATQDITIAVTGAQTPLRVNGVPQQLNTAVKVLQGQKLQLGQAIVGARNYIACNIPFAASYFLDSCCAVLRELSGGLHNNGLGFKVNDVIAYESAKQRASKQESLKQESLKQESLKQESLKQGAAIHGATGNAVKIRNEPVGTGTQDIPETLKTIISPVYKVGVVLGYQHELFEHTQKALFFNQTYRVSTDANSMGMRLDGTSMGQQSVTMYSEGIANGAIQITPNGLPIIMLSERQTIGGYPKIGSIISDDLPELGQCRPGSLIEFQECDMFTARQRWLLRQMKLSNFAKAQSNYGERK